MNKILIILILLFLTSCEYDYLHDNPNHPQEYFGNWVCDSTYLNGVKSNNVEKRNFLIMQTGVNISSVVDIHKINYYYDFKIDKSKNIPIFMLLNDKYIEVMSYEIIKEPYNGILGLKLNNVIYYLSN